MPPCLSFRIFVVVPAIYCYQSPLFSPPCVFNQCTIYVNGLGNGLFTDLTADREWVEICMLPKLGAHLLLKLCKTTDYVWSALYTVRVAQCQIGISKYRFITVLARLYEYKMDILKECSAYLIFCFYKF